MGVEQNSPIFTPGVANRALSHLAQIVARAKGRRRAAKNNGGHTLVRSLALDGGMKRGNKLKGKAIARGGPVERKNRDGALAFA